MDASPLTHGRRFHLLPGTSPGRWSIGLLVAGLAFFLLTTISVAAGQSGGANPLILLPMGAAGVSTLLGGATAALAIIRRGERAVVVFAPLIIGVLVALFLIGEFTTPH
jgi:hypothetical protein